MLRLYAERGQIDYIKTAGGQRRYNVESLHQGTFKISKPIIPPSVQEAKTGQGAIYARVSSHKQKDDLQRQIKALKDKYPTFKVYKDVCSGLKYKRKGLTRLLEHIQSKHISKVVVAHKDRLVRFGCELIEWIFNQAGATLIIEDHSKLSYEEEFTQDLLSIVHVFSCKLNGKRKYSTKRKREEKTITGVQREVKRRKETLESPDGSRVEEQPTCQSLSEDTFKVNSSTAQDAPTLV